MTAASLPLICGVESFSGRGELPRAMCDFVGPFFTFELEGDPNQVFLTKEACCSWCRCASASKLVACCGLGRRASPGSCCLDDSPNAVSYNQRGLAFCIAVKHKHGYLEERAAIGLFDRFVCSDNCGSSHALCRRTTSDQLTLQVPANGSGTCCCGGCDRRLQDGGVQW